MSMPMSNIDKGGYVPPNFGAGYPSVPNEPSAPPSSGPPGHPGAQPSRSDIENQLFLFGPPAGYAAVPQMPPYGEVPGQSPYGGAPPPHGMYGPQMPYMQPPYGGEQPQPPYGGPNSQPPYGGGGMAPGYGPPPGPIVMQPGLQPQPGQPMGPPGEWMSIPAGIPNCPRGLEYLTSVDQLLVKQKVELLEAFTGFETANKYTVKNALGQKVYHAIEENDCCTRNMCGPARPFEMRIFDNFRNEVLHLSRPLACTSCCFPCCLQKMEVSSPPGNVIGTVEQEWTICSPAFTIRNHIGDAVIRIEGPFCTFSLCGDVEFSVVSLTGEQIGKISKQWSGFAREIFTDADFFGINFPMDLDVRIKAVLLGACFLIDYMFFEKRANNESDAPGML